jgi:hypothetical protein
MARLPVPKPVHGAAHFHALASLARTLERDGVDGHDEHFVRVNTIASHLYGLTRRQYEHVLSTFPLLPTSLRSECLRRYGDQSWK